MALAAAILAPFFYLAGRVMPAVLTRVSRMQSPELFMLVALAVVLGTAALTQAVGLSLALGAFLAGLLISQSDYAHEALVRLLPIRDAFVALFFVTMGALINPAALVQHLEILLVLVGLIVVGKFLIWMAIVWLFRQPLWTAVLVGAGLTQIGEFSFILVGVARSAGHVGDDVYQATWPPPSSPFWRTRPSCAPSHVGSGGCGARRSRSADPPLRQKDSGTTWCSAGTVASAVRSERPLTRSACPTSPSKAIPTSSKGFAHEA